MTKNKRPERLRTFVIERDRLFIEKCIREHTKSSIEELARSMADIGQISPIGVLPANENGLCEVIFGIGRYKAAGILGWEHLDAIELPGGCEPGEALRIATSENLVRKSMSFLEQWEIIFQYAQETGQEIQSAGQDLGFKQSTISKIEGANKRVSPSNKKALSDAGVGLTKVYELSLADEPFQSDLVKRVIDEGMTREQIRAAIKPTKLGLRRFEYRNPSGEITIAIPRNAAASSISDLLRDVGSELKKCQALTSDPAVLAVALKERSRAI